MQTEKQTARRPWRPPIALIVLACFVIVPLAEIAVLIEVGGWLGLGATLALIVLTAVAGAWMLRRQGLAVLRRAQRQMQEGTAPVGEVFEGFCLVIAGALLLTPGFLTDGVGALLLVPPVRSFLYRRLRRRIEEHVVTPGSDPGRQARQRPAQPERPATVVDVEFDEVVPDEMPEPRGGWDRRS